MFDLIGDVHGCSSELRTLLLKLGYVDTAGRCQSGVWKHPDGRKVVFVGDLNDRGPDSVGAITVAMRMCLSGNALAVIGNHDDKLLRYLKGNKVTPGHGLAETIRQIEEGPEWLRDEIHDFLSTLPFELTLDNGRLSVSHAGLPEKHQGQTHGKARSHALFGDVDGKSKDENGYPIRKDWAQDYKGTRIVVHGHVPVKEVRTVGNVWDIDTGACFGNKLTALRYPEMQIVQVQSAENYAGIDKFGTESGAE